MNTKQIKRRMAEMGFKIVREGRHLLWSDGIVTVTTSKSPSCAYAWDNILRDIRRERRKLEGRAG